MTEVQLDWSTAHVKDGKLTVELEGEFPKGWKRAFEMTDRLLGGGDWGEVRVKRNTVRISDVTPGAEEKLGHHLESVVEQANAAVRGPEPADDEEERDDDSPDARMTESFRSFAKDSQET